MTDAIDTAATASAEAPAAAAPTKRRRTAVFLAALTGTIAVGAAGLGAAQGIKVEPTLVAPVAVSALAPSEATAVKGQVAEIFGNKFVIGDGTGRMLVETGKAGEGREVVRTGETVTAQGKFEKGFLHARLILKDDGSRVELTGKGGPKTGSLDWAKEKAGLTPAPDVTALTAAAEKAGYSDIRITGRGPKHLDAAAKKADGAETRLHLGFDGAVREKGAPKPKA